MQRRSSQDRIPTTTTRLTFLAIVVSTILFGMQPASASAAPLFGSVYDGLLSSSLIGRELPYRVYLPPDYFADDRRYPVLYMLHGAGGTYTEWGDSFLPERADELIQAGEIQPMI